MVRQSFDRLRTGFTTNVRAQRAVPLLFRAFFHAQFQDYVPPTATLYSHIKAASPLESHFVWVYTSIKEFI
jgi:hypothetical protein